MSSPEITKEAKLVKNINKGNVTIIIFLLTILILTAVGIVGYEIYANKKTSSNNVNEMEKAYDDYVLLNDCDEKKIELSIRDI